MERVLDVAQYIMDEYKKMTGETIDEMKLHKLLYFSQRECLALTNKPLFEEIMQKLAVWNQLIQEQARKS